MADPIKSGNTTTCGNCGNIYNGHTTSKISLSLRKFLPIFALHNYEYGKPNIHGQYKNVDWAFVYKGNKIALEYDEWYWHGHKQTQDRNRYKQLVRKNWKIIQIKARNNIPTQKQINKALEKIVNGAKKVCITLPGWGKGKTIADRKHKEAA